MNAIGIDLGGTQIKAVLASPGGEILRKEIRLTEDDGGTGRKWAQTIRELAAELGEGLPLGISTPGLIARDGRSVAWLENRLRGLAGLDWTTWLGRSEPVPLLNDAHASLLAETWVGAGRGMRDVFMLTLGTGVGGAILSDGKILRGHLGRAGHLGHVCLDWRSENRSITGMPGALEWFVGNYSIEQRTGGAYRSTLDLAADVRAGNYAAIEFWDEITRPLAAGIASLVNVLDPEAVILGGGIAMVRDVLFTRLQRDLDRCEWRPTGRGVPLLLAELGEFSGALGAARHAMLVKAAAV